MYQWFKDWTAKRDKTDIWRASVGVILVVLIILALTGCAAPRMTLAASTEGDAFIRMTQPIVQTKHGEVFIEYEHHSEIFQEFDEDTGDFVMLGYTHQFDDWRWNK